MQLRPVHRDLHDLLLDHLYRRHLDQQAVLQAIRSMVKVLLLNTILSKTRSLLSEHLTNDSRRSGLNTKVSYIAAILLHPADRNFRIGEIITAWMDVAIKEVRQAKCSSAVNGLMDSGSLRDYPEVSCDQMWSTITNVLRVLTNLIEILASFETSFRRQQFARSRLSSCTSRSSHLRLPT